MARIATLVVLTLTVTLMFLSCGPSAREVKQYTIQEFLATTSFTGASFSPDQSLILVSSNKTGIFNAYALPTDGGDPVALTRSTDNSIFALAYFPDDERFLYTSDQGGNELNHVYVQETDGTVHDLTPGEKLKAVFGTWSWDRGSFYILTNERDQQFFDVYEYSADDYSRSLVFTNTQGLNFVDASPDRTTLLLSKTNTMTDSDIHLFNVESGTLTYLTPHRGEITHNAQGFSPDGKSIYYLTNKESEFEYLVRRDLASGSTEVVLKPEWDVMYSAFSRDGTYLVIGINNDARTELRIFKAATMEPVLLPELPDAEISSVTFSPDEESIAFYASASKLPSDLFLYQLGGGSPRQLTRSLNPRIEGEDLVDGSVERFASFDGLAIPGILYMPHQASHQNPVPGLVWVHGGPGGQSRIGYSALLQYLVNHGYAVFAINNRGSSGYGKTFYKLDDRAHGEGDLDDCVASKTMLYKTGLVDSSRIGIIGGSYGGYMVLAALTFRPAEFAAGVDMFGISNWYRTVQNIPPWWESMRKALEAEMGDFNDQAYFKRISPLFHAERIVRPLMVLQGANDPRVLKVESDEIVAAARANGVPVEYVVFDDEGHGFLKKENREKGYEAVLKFLDKHLKGLSESD
jgi:dipeptidyl aminopeptidase/acylaminoacyl peptidase